MNFGLFSEDAFLYKDLTQWLRRRTFLPLFFGLLVAGEVVTVSNTLRPAAGGESGRVIYYLLLTLLVLFGLFILVQSCLSTTHESEEKLFETYMLSGIHPEMVVKGKACSMMIQFVFGLCCLVPFMFFALLHGNLGFLELLLCILGLLCAFPLLALWALWTGFAMATLDSSFTRLMSFITQVFLLLIATLFALGLVATVQSIAGTYFVAPGLLAVALYAGSFLLLYREAAAFVPCIPKTKMTPFHPPEDVLIGQESVTEVLATQARSDTA